MSIIWMNTNGILQKGLQNGQQCLSAHKSKINSTAAQQSVHLTLGILRTSQAVFYALAFFWLDGFAVPAPAQVTQTVSQPHREIAIRELPS